MDTERLFAELAVELGLCVVAPAPKLRRRRPARTGATEGAETSGSERVRAATSASSAAER